MNATSRRPWLKMVTASSTSAASQAASTGRRPRVSSFTWRRAYEVVRSLAHHICRRWSSGLGTMW